MNEHDTPGADRAPSPHPLARALADALTPKTNARVLVLGIGNGRNVTPFTQFGAHVDAIEEDETRARDAVRRFSGEGTVRVAHASYAGPYPFEGAFDGALSTNGLLHGTRDAVARSAAAVLERLAPGAPLYATFGSTRDPRFERGRSVAEGTVVDLGGSEAGVAHAYFDEPSLRRALRGFAIDEMVERSAAETAGRWAHAAGEAATIVHWFVRARRAT